MSEHHCINVLDLTSCGRTVGDMTEEATIRQQSSENNSVSSSEWDMANDVFVSSYDDSAAAEDQDPAQPSLERHLPLLSQGGMMLGLTGEEYPASSYLDMDLNYTESDGNVATKKRIRSNSSRHRGDIVTELGPEEVRWFYKEDKRTWKPFVGHDSLKIEIVHRRFCEQNPKKVKRPVDPTEVEGKETSMSDEIESESGARDDGGVPGGAAGESGRRAAALGVRRDEGSGRHQHQCGGSVCQRGALWSGYQREGMLSRLLEPWVCQCCIYHELTHCY